MAARVASEKESQLNASDRYAAPKALRCIDTSLLNPIPRPSRKRLIRAPIRFKVLDMAWHSDGRHVVSVNQIGAVVYWNAVTKKAMQYYERNLVTAAAVAPTEDGDDKAIVAVGGLDDKITVLDMSPDLEDCDVGNTLPGPEREGHEGLITALAFRTASELISASGDGNLRIWDIQSGLSTSVLRGHEAGLRCVSLCAREPFMAASGAVDKSVRLWDVRTGKATRTFKCADEVMGVSCFPTGGIVAAGCSDGSVQAFDVRACAMIADLKEKKKAAPCTSVQVCPWPKGLAHGQNTY